MKLAIFGTKTEAQYLKRQIQQNAIADVIAFVDNNQDNHKSYIEELPIIPFEHLQAMYGNGIDSVIVVAKGPDSRAAILKQLSEGHIKNVGLFNTSYSEYHKAITNLNDSVIWLSKIQKAFLPYLEYNVTDSCNLKCKGCLHFSNLFEDNTFSDYNQFCRDLKQLSDNICIAQLRLLGGEPLLHPDLDKFIIHARKLLPYAEINIVTNGLLIPKCSKNLFTAMRKSDVSFHISRYIPTNSQINSIIDILNEESINYRVDNATITEFSKFLDTRGINDGKNSQKICMSGNCRFLRNGKLFKCALEGMIYQFSKVYGCQDLPDNSGTDIYQNDIDWSGTLERYLYPTDMCHFCTEKSETFSWKVETHPKKDDWIIDL